MKTYTSPSSGLNCNGSGVLETVASTSAIPAANQKVLRLETTVPAPVAEVWRAWTTSAGLEEFFAPKANVKLRAGGAFEIFFDPTDDTKSTRGLKVLSYAPNEMLSFQWGAPPQFPQVRAGSLWVVIFFHPTSNSLETHLTIELLGWKDGPEWELGFEHLKVGWSDLIGRLQHRFTEGPIVWAAEMATGAEKEHFSLQHRTHA